MRAAIGPALGGLFGLSFPTLISGIGQRTIAALYAGKRSVTDSSPAELSIHFQIPCTLIHNKTGVLGVLFLGRNGLFFAPAKRSRLTRPQPIQMTPMIAAKISLVESSPQNLDQRWLVPRPQR